MLVKSVPRFATRTGCLTARQPELAFILTASHNFRALSQTTGTGVSSGKLPCRRPTACSVFQLELKCS